MSKRAWYNNDDFLDKWAGVSTVVVLAISAPGVFSDLAAHRSPWHIFVLIVWLFVACGLVISILLRWSRRRNTYAAVSVQRRDPDTVPTEAVRDAIASSPSQIAAIKLLRERVPGLRLADAAHLIDAHLPVRPEH